MREDLIVEASFPPSSPESSRHNPSSYIVSIIRGDHESRERSRIVHSSGPDCSGKGLDNRVAIDVNGRSQ
jgi:hypothetical protein